MQGRNKLLRKAEKNIPDFVIGLDPSLTSFGVFVMPVGSDEESKPYHTSYKTNTKVSDFFRVQSQFESVQALLDSYNIVMAAIEDYGPVGRTAGKITMRAEICGLIKRHIVCNLEVPLLTVPPTSLRRFATGKANQKGGKDEVMQRAASEGYIFDTNDEADAYFCAKLASYVLAGKPTESNYTRHNPRR